MLFVLNIDNNVLVDVVRLRSLDAGLWQFGSLVTVTDKDGNILDWDVLSGSSELLLKAGGEYGHEPIYITVNMAVHSSNASDLWNGSLTYNGQGETPDGLELVSFSGTVSGTVTPEPVSIVLLGTGLAGIAGVARRRRQRALSQL